VGKWGDDGGGHWLVRMEWRPAGWSKCLPLLIFLCTISPEVFFWHRLTRVVPEKGCKTVVVEGWKNVHKTLYEYFRVDITDNLI